MNKVWKDYAQVFLGTIIVIGFFVILIVVFRNGIPTENKDIGLLVVGALVAKFGDIVSYFYGSSKGSSDKNEMLRNGK